VKSQREEARAAISEALKAAESMANAILAAAELLMSCTCQNQRRPQAIRALKMADESTKRWMNARTRLIAIAHAQSQNGSPRAN